MTKSEIAAFVARMRGAKVMALKLWPDMCCIADSVGYWHRQHFVGPHDVENPAQWAGDSSGWLLSVGNTREAIEKDALERAAKVELTNDQIADILEVEAAKHASLGERARK